MRVYVVEHEADGRKVYCPTKQQALETISICLAKQIKRAPSNRESMTVSVQKISAAEFAKQCA